MNFWEKTCVTMTISNGVAMAGKTGIEISKAGSDFIRTITSRNEELWQTWSPEETHSLPAETIDC